MNEDNIVNGYYQSNIKTSRNEHSVYAMKYASQQMMINKLQEENQQLKEENEKLKLQNFNLREDIMIQKKSFPNKEIKDKTFFDLYDMPTYEQLKYRIDKALFELRKYKLVRNNDDLVSFSAMYEFIIDNSIEILKGDNND